MHDLLGWQYHLFYQNEINECKCTCKILNRLSVAYLKRKSGR